MENEISEIIENVIKARRECVDDGNLGDVLDELGAALLHLEIARNYLAAADE